MQISARKMKTHSVYIKIHKILAICIDDQFLYIIAAKYDGIKLNESRLLDDYVHLIDEGLHVM